MLVINEPTRSSPGNFLQCMLYAKTMLVDENILGLNSIWRYIYNRRVWANPNCINCINHISNEWIFSENLSSCQTSKTNYLRDPWLPVCKLPSTPYFLRQESLLTKCYLNSYQNDTANKILSTLFKGIYQCHNDLGGNKNVESVT